MDTLILSLGGSIIFPNKNRSCPDYFFLKDFKNFILRNLEKRRFVIVCGGGKINSNYNEAALKVSNISKENLDWLGIMATRLNAELVRVIFGDLAHKKVIYNPEKKKKKKKKVIVAAGYKPGCSTDFDAVLLAEQLGSNTIINMTNTSHVYNKDPNKFKDAVKLNNISWKEYKKIIGRKWSPRMNCPFDPVASKKAEELGLKVVILKGTDLKNLEDCINKKDFVGTVIE